MLYSLIHDDQLLLGPIQYNYQLINFDLEELEIPQRLTSQSYNQVPIQFDEKTFLLPAKEEFEEYDAKYKRLLSPTWNIRKEDEVPVEVVFSYSATDRNIEEVKQERKIIVKEGRKNKENANIVLTVQGTEISVSTGIDNRLALASKLSSSPGPHNFKFGEDVWLQITSTDLEYIIRQIDLKIQEAFDWEFSKVQEIDACTTIDEVYNVEIIPATPPTIIPNV
jgi:hypothetical protein